MAPHLEWPSRAKPSQLWVVVLQQPAVLHGGPGSSWAEELNGASCSLDQRRLQTIDGLLFTAGRVQSNGRAHCHRHTAGSGFTGRHDAAMCGAVIR